jgi:hypothetical protein
VPVLFPGYAEAAGPAAALVASVLPLGLCAWLLPLAIAKARRPWAEAAGIFAAAFLGLGAAMLAGEGLGGVLGQAWGCTLAALMPLGALLSRLAGAGLLPPDRQRQILMASALAVALGGLAWLLLFGLQRAA